MAWKQQEFDDSCRKFRNLFPDFATFDIDRRGKRYLEEERAYKDRLVNLYNDKVRKALTKSDLQFFQAYVEILNPAADQFVDWRFADELGRLPENDSSKYGGILRQVIELDGSSDSITSYGEVASGCLKSIYGPKKSPPWSEVRSLVTLLLMLHNPKKFMCEKFGYWNKSTKLLMGKELLERGSLVTGEEFEQCQNFAERVYQELKRAGLSPIDMIDVQSFLFIILTRETWNQRAFELSLEQFKRRYPGFRDFNDCGETYVSTQQQFKRQIRDRYKTKVKPLIEQNPADFFDAFVELIDIYVTQRPDELTGWRALTNGISNDLKPEFGSILQSLVNAKATRSRGKEWESIVADYERKSKELFGHSLLKSDSHQVREKLRESATLLLALRWPQKWIHVAQSVWNVAGKNFIEREVVKSDDMLSVEFIQSLAGFTGQINGHLIEANLLPKGQSDKFNIHSFLWSVYDESRPLSEPRSPDGRDNDHSTLVAPRRPSLKEIVQRIRSKGMRIDEAAVRQYDFSMRSRGFVILAGPSGVGKTWLTRLYANVLNAEYLPAPVAPNWSTNEDLLGFFNPVDGNFHATAFLNFIDRSASSWDELGHHAPEFHLVLDEMNLARVEHYFSLFLSLMEMRREADVPETRLTGDRVVRVPPNLKFAGTVNMDETTHGFADKVFDRAQLIELSISSDAAREHVSERMGDTAAAEVLLNLWDRMARACPVGFRVLDDIADYLKLADEEGVDWTVALDEQIVSKLLPKLRGLDPEVAEALRQVMARVDGEFPRAAAKCHSMLQRLQATDVVSFF